MSDGIILPNGKVLFTNGARQGCAGSNPAVSYSRVVQGFYTYGQAMGQRMVKMGFKVFAPRGESVISPGICLLFVVGDDIPSEGK
jgi:hypothetical protein